MPGVLPGNRRVRPLRIAIVFDRSYRGRARARELRALRAWLAANHNPRTRLFVADRGGSPARVVRHALAGQRGRMLVTTGHHTTPAFSRAATLRVDTRRGAATPAAVPLGPGGRRVVAIDPRRRRALAATVARSIISVSGMRER
jgi:hypothetical protein